MRFAALFLVALLSASSALADLRPVLLPAPPPVAGTEAKIVVEVDRAARTPRLVIPRRIVVNKAELDQQMVDPIVDADQEEGRPWKQTLLAGIALAAAVSCAGLLVVRRTRSTKALALAIAAGGVLAVGTLALADIPGPGRGPRPRPPIQVPPTQVYSGNVTVEYIAQGDSIKLIVPPDMVALMAKGALNAGGIGAPPGGIQPPGSATPIPETKPPATEPKP